jgi:hypothetical protein
MVSNPLRRPSPTPPPPGRLLAVAAVDAPGGAETTLLRLLARLRSRGWEVTLTTPPARARDGRRVPERVGLRATAAGARPHRSRGRLPSRQEPFGTVLAEAMAVGTPVVATRVGGLAEVVDDGVTGRLVEPGEPQAQAAAVLEVLRNRDRMGAAARERSKRFDAGRYAEHVERLIA